MTIGVGDKIPDVKVTELGEGGPQPVQTGEVLGKGKVVLFAVPGAFTPTCNDHHLPGFVVRIDEFKAKDVDTIACISVNDAWVMGAWGKAQGVGDEIRMLADGNGEFARAMGREINLSVAGLGPRSARYAAIIEDGVVTSLSLEDGPGLKVTSAEAVLAAL